jgi:pimeloyl-ACP methyl ester carboxylesterase
MFRFCALLLCALAASTLDGTPACSATPASNEERLAHISIRSVGSGSPVVLIPGLSTPREVWAGIAPDLAKGHRVLLVQVNGFGGDDPGANLKPGILDGIAADLHAYVAKQKLGRVEVIGHSMGGLAALMYAKAQPADVSRVMIVDSLPFFGVLSDPSATVDSIRPTAELMRARVASAYGKPVDPAAVEANVQSLALKPASLVAMRTWAAAADPRVTAEALYEDLTTDLRPQLPNIATPVTVIVPWSKDKFGEDLTIAFYRHQYEGLSKASFVGIGDAGHFVMLDQPEAFRTAVDAFIK